MLNWIESEVNDAIHRTLADVADFLNKQDVPFAVIGGIAAAVRGEPRFTADVDIVVGIELDRAVALIDAAGKTPFRPLLSDAADVVRVAFLLPLRHIETNIKVDLAIGVTGFERQMITRSTIVEFGDCSMPVATSEDLILMKLLAGRPRDTDDASGIIARQGEALDWEYLLKVGGELQQAVSQDILNQLQRLR